MPAGIRTDMEKCPIPSTKGVYKPKGINNVEKLIPGAITLNARQKPQKMYHAKLGVISTEEVFNVIKKLKEIGVVSRQIRIVENVA